MTRKKERARLGRAIRKATGLSFPLAMRLGKLAAAGSLGGFLHPAVRPTGPICPSCNDTHAVKVIGPAGTWRPY